MLISMCLPVHLATRMAAMIYGNFIQPKHEAINGPHVYWQQAMNLPGANQMKYVRRLIESHPMIERVPDQSIDRRK